MNITLTIDDEIVEKVSKIAVDKNTTLTAMVLEFLASVADTETPSLDAAARKEAADKLRAHIAFRANRPAEERDQTGSEEAVQPAAGKLGPVEPLDGASKLDER